ncbi:isoprenyl transferase [Desulfobacter vibrioformis]|uniref:isoprenyl transferase n=1 Tax=Desulfobacter vibrioformis TaxID=34031 RepID=UPI000A05814B|nr:isoprenyl transferase [Desulfobacter vibrioformis]
MKSDSSIQVPDELDLNAIPAHVAFIMDGNGRWAKKRLMNRAKGHEQGVQTVEEVVSACRDLGIGVLTLYAFSTENWARPKVEVKALMHLLKRFLRTKTEEIRKKDIRLNIMGQIERLPDDVRKEAEQAMAVTQKNSAMILNLALSYGAREEITRAVQQIAAKIKSGILEPKEITDKTVSDHLYTAGMPDPDLIIRTSAEFRLSNFLMWQAAYSELAFTPTLWPDFTRQEFYQILIDYQQRDRRFGKV